MEQTHLGVKGIVTNTEGDPVSGAEVFVSGINWNVTTTSDGEFWRIIVPGNYTIVVVGDEGMSGLVDVSVDGMKTSIVNITLNLKESCEALTWVNTFPVLAHYLGGLWTHLLYLVSFLCY